MSWLWIWLATLCSFVSSNPPCRSSRSNFSDAPKNYCELYFQIILTACWYNNWLIVTLGQYQWLQELYILAFFGFFCEVLLQEHCRILWIKHFTLRFYSRNDSIFDCLFESGSMPYFPVPFPFENSKEFEDCFFADFIAEGIIQLRSCYVC